MVTGSLVLWRRSGLAWLVLLGYVVLNLALLARSRATLVGPVVGTDYRYQTDIAVVAAVCLGLATMPSQREPSVAVAYSACSRGPRHASGSPNRCSPATGGRGSTSSTHQVARATALSTTGLLVASALWSTAAYDPLWVNNPAAPT